MRYVEIAKMTLEEAKAKLFEMPVLLTNAEDFRLSDPEWNQHEYFRLEDLDYKVIEERPTYVLAHNYDRQDGYGEIFLLVHSTKKVVYYARYTIKVFAPIGLCATQVILWRRGASTVKNVTSKVFEDFLVKTFDGVVSDEEQTADGKRFWVDRLGEAAAAGLSVGLLDGDEIVATCNGGDDIDAFLARTNGWGPEEHEEHYKRLRYFISKKKLPSIA